MMNTVETKNVEVVEVAKAEETKTVKKVSLRQNFLKGFSVVAEHKTQVMEITGLSEDDFNTMVEYFNTQINKTKTVKKGEYVPTEKAQLILDVLIAYEGEYKTGKEIAEMSNGELKSNGVSGSIRGLVSNGFVEATNDSPKKYKITEMGVNYMNEQ